jgi:hypothetical protein
MPFLPLIIVARRVPCSEAATRNRNSGEETGGKNAKEESSAVRRSLKGMGEKKRARVSV